MFNLSNVLYCILTLYHVRTLARHSWIHYTVCWILK